MKKKIFSGVQPTGNLHIGNYDLTFFKNNDLDGLDYDDFRLILEYYQGNIELESNQDSLNFLRSADVNLDTMITGLDLSRIAQNLVGFQDFLNDDNIHWIFKPKTILPYSPLVADDTLGTIDGYRLGDVDGDWNCSGENNGNQRTKQIDDSQSFHGKQSG